MVGSKGFGVAWKGLGGGSKGLTAAHAGIMTTNLSAGQIGGIAIELGNLYDSATEMGFDPGSLNMQAIGDAALVAAVGGKLNIDPQTGEVSAKMLKAGSRIQRSVTIGSFEQKEENWSW